MPRWRIRVPQGLVVVTEPTHRLVGLAWLLVLGCVAAMGFGVPALAACVLPFAIFLMWGLGRDRELSCQVRVELDRDRAFEGESVTITLALTADSSWERVLCELHFPPELVVVDPPARVALEPETNGHARATIEVRCLRWGVHMVGPVTFQAQHKFGLFFVRGATTESPSLRVYPAPLPLRTSLRPTETQVFVGNQLARQRADGLKSLTSGPICQVIRCAGSTGGRRRVVGCRTSTSNILSTTLM